MTLNKETKKHFSGSKSENLKMHEGIRELISGSVGGIVSTVAGHPLDTIKTRVQAFPHLYKNSVHCCLKIIRKEGPRALGKGLLPPVMAQAGMNSILFASEGTVRRSLQVCHWF